MVRSAIEMAEIPQTGRVQYDEFVEIEGSFPNMILPILQMQSACRRKFMGEEYWADKRQVFTQARGIVLDQRHVELNTMRIAVQERQAKIKAMMQLEEIETKAARDRQARQAALEEAGGGIDAFNAKRAAAKADAATPSKVNDTATVGSPTPVKLPAI